MMDSIIFWSVVPISFVFSIVTIILIICYLKQKPFALQTILDYHIIDSLTITLFFELFALLPYALHFAEIILNTFYAHFILITFRYILTLWICSCLATIMIKAIMIFFPYLFENASDEGLNKMIRRRVLIVSFAIFTFDLIPFLKVEKPINYALALMTGNQNEE